MISVSKIAISSSLLVGNTSAFILWKSRKEQQFLYIPFLKVTIQMMKLFFVGLFFTLLLFFIFYFAIGKTREIGDSNVCCDYFMDVCMGINCDDSCCDCDACIDFPGDITNQAVQNLGHCKWLKWVQDTIRCCFVLDFTIFDIIFIIH